MRLAPHSLVVRPYAMGPVHVYSAERYVIGIRTPSSSRKLFQVVFARDGSLFVTFPYYRTGSGRLGIVHLDPTLTYPTSITVGDNFPATANYVKYSHHPTGRAHFSLSGKISSRVGKQASPLADANGHVFTVMLQGVEYFDAVSSKDKGDKKRGVALFPFESTSVEAVKFLGMLYPERMITRMVRHQAPSPWMNVIAPDRSMRPGLLLNTPLVKDGQRYFLMLSAERIKTICAQQDVFINLMGGFDMPEIALNRSKPTSYLMFIYPSHSDFGELVRQFGTVDL